MCMKGQIAGHSHKVKMLVWLSSGIKTFHITTSLGLLGGVYSYNMSSSIISPTGLGSLHRTLYIASSWRGDINSIGSMRSFNVIKRVFETRCWHGLILVSWYEVVLGIVVNPFFVTKIAQQDETNWAWACFPNTHHVNSTIDIHNRRGGIQRRIWGDQVPLCRHSSIISLHFT